MDHDHNMKDTWNKLALAYQDKFMELDIYNESYDIFCERISDPVASILDVGCGPGNITKYLLTRSGSYRIQGIDLAENMVELAAKNNPTAHFKVVDARDMKNISGWFDGIICGFCLPYLSAEELEHFAGDCAALLRPGGVCYWSFVEGDPERSGVQSNKNGDQLYFNYHRAGYIKDQLEKHSFDLLNELTVSYVNNKNETELHTVIITKKKSSATQ